MFQLSINRMTRYFLICGIVLAVVLQANSCSHKQQKYLYLYYDTYRLVLTFDSNEKLTEWVILRPSKNVLLSKSILNRDSTVLPLVGAFGVQFNMSAEAVKGVLGQPKYSGCVDKDTVIFTSLGWVFQDGYYLNIMLRHDSVARIASNAAWATLPKQVKIGIARDSILLLYGKPSLVSSTPAKSLW
jgi:hypothetical protein